eukprot:scpid27922/ scgid17384/ 
MLGEQKIQNSHSHHIHNNTRTLSPTKLLTPSAMSSTISRSAAQRRHPHFCSLFFFSSPSILLFFLFQFFFWAQFYVVSGTTSDDDCQETGETNDEGRGRRTNFFKTDKTVTIGRLEMTSETGSEGHAGRIQKLIL